MQTQQKQSGQAMCEFLIGIVAFMAVFAGLLQLASLTTTHTDTMVEARRQAAERAMWDTETGGPFPYFNTIAPYIHEMQEHNGKRHTAGDTYTTADPDAFNNQVVAKATSDEDEWQHLEDAYDSHFENLYGSSVPNAQFGMTKGYSDNPVELISAVEKLLYKQDSINVKCTVWMTRTAGMY